MRFIVMTCAGREHYLPYLKRHMPPGTEYSFDDTGGGAMGNYLKALGMAGTDACVIMEDDVILTRGFEEKCIAAVMRHPARAIQFFSMRRADLTEGSRLEHGRTFLMNQCVYMPPGMARAVIRFYHEAWARRSTGSDTDSMLAAFLSACKLCYWLHVPSLVDHRVGRSIINPKRASTNRQSLTFRDPTPDQD